MTGDEIYAGGYSALECHASKVPLTLITSEDAGQKGALFVALQKAADFVQAFLMGFEVQDAVAVSFG